MGGESTEKKKQKEKKKKQKKEKGENKRKREETTKKKKTQLIFIHGERKIVATNLVRRCLRAELGDEIVDLDARPCHGAGDDGPVTEAVNPHAGTA